MLASYIRAARRSLSIQSWRLGEYGSVWKPLLKENPRPPNT
jgi:hypothetical protein